MEKALSATEKKEVNCIVIWKTYDITKKCYICT